MGRVRAYPERVVVPGAAVSGDDMCDSEYDTLARLSKSRRKNCISPQSFEDPEAVAGHRISDTR